ncbi:MAG: CsiV family protein [Woeseia sp.]
MQLLTERDETGRWNATDPLRRVFALVTIAVMAAISSLAPPARAQQNIAPLAADMPRYTVELIVFTYTADGSSGSEIFVPDKPRQVPGPDDYPNANLQPDASADLRGETPDLAGPDATDAEGALREVQGREQIELYLLEPDDYTMDEIYRHLDRLDAYEPIMRTAWTQTTPAKEVSPAVHLRALGNPPPGLDGSVTLYLGRFLHLAVDLALDAGTERNTMTATDRLVAYGDERVRNEDGDELDGMLQLPVRYRIVEDRIMKTGDIRYYDHPRFGVVAKITRAKDNARSGSDGITEPGVGAN